jgi:glycosyltransferase involved in cell wall biosynthesis
MAKIRIALCITELDLGGAERCLTELAVRIDRQRFEPVVYCLGPRPVHAETSCLPALEAAGIKVHCLGGRHLWQFPLVLTKLKKLLLAQRPHVTQTFLFHANILGRIAARRAKVGKVISGIRVAERAAHWHLWLDRLTQNYVDRYVCVSRAVSAFSETIGCLSLEKLVVIPNGIDVDRYPAPKKADLTTFGFASGRRAVVFVGRLESQKGVSWLIETASIWLKQLPDCDLLLVGEGPLRGQLEAICQTLGIAERVHFAGWRADVPEILVASDLLVLPSRWEGMPNVVLEAMASRRPIVATNVEGVCELLGSSVSRQAVPHGNTQDFTEKVVEILRNPKLAEELGQKNRRRAEQKFAIAQMVAAYQELWLLVAESA